MFASWVEWCYIFCSWCLSHISRKSTFNLFPQRTTTADPFENILEKIWKSNDRIELKTLWQEEKLLIIMSNFSFYHNCFFKLSAAKASVWGKGLTFLRRKVKISLYHDAQLWHHFDDVFYFIQFCRNHHWFLKLRRSLSCYVTQINI